MKTINFRSLSLFWNFIIAVILFILFYFLLMLILSPYIHRGVAGAIALYGGVFSSSFISKYFTASDTTISIENGCVCVSSYNELSNLSKTKYLLSQDIIGFEICKTKIFHALILYRQDSSPHTITLAGVLKEEAEIISHLKNYFPLITKEQTLSATSWGQAFTTALKNVMLLYGGILLSYVLLLWFNFSFTHNLLSIHYFFLLALPFPFLLYFNKRHYKLNFRIPGRNVTWISCLFASFVGGVILPKTVLPMIQNIVVVNNLNETINNGNQKFFKTRSLLADTSTLGYKSDITSERRSSYHAVSHTFAVPALIPKSGKINHHVWLGKRYMQKIRKNQSQSAKNSQRLKFMNGTAGDFKKTIVNITEFYEVKYSQLNRAFNDMQFFKSAASTDHLESPVIVLEPHSETFDEYRKSEQKNILLGVATIIVVIFINAILIAMYR